MSLQPQTFHPELDAIFDDAQDKGVSVSFGERNFVLLSQKSFDVLLKGTTTTADMVQHVAVPRVDKPITYILSREAFDDLVELHKTLISLIDAQARLRRPH